MELGFRLVPIITDHDLYRVFGTPEDGLQVTGLTFTQRTAPGPLTTLTATTRGFDRIDLAWADLTPTLEDGAAIVGYRVFYRLACAEGVPYACQTKNPQTLAPQVHGAQLPRAQLTNAQLTRLN